MAAAPRVAVSRWEDVAGERIEAYWRRLRDAGLEPVDFDGVARHMADCDALVLTGGLDIDPGSYGQEFHPKTGHVDGARDAFERMLLAEALFDDKPVLAICRGHQLLNVHLGGSLLQHIDSGEHVAQRDEEHTSRTHSVRLDEDGLLSAVYGTVDMTVNSRHHQAVTHETLAPKLHIAALSQDGLIEAVTSEEHRWVVGVQWHPEREEPGMPGFATASTRLFAAFAAAINAR